MHTTVLTGSSRVPRLTSLECERKEFLSGSRIPYTDATLLQAGVAEGLHPAIPSLARRTLERGTAEPGRADAVPDSDVDEQRSLEAAGSLGRIGYLDEAVGRGAPALVTLEEQRERLLVHPPSPCGAASPPACQGSCHRHEAAGPRSPPQRSHYRRASARPVSAEAWLDLDDGAGRFDFATRVPKGIPARAL